MSSTDLPGWLNGVLPTVARSVVAATAGAVQAGDVRRLTVDAAQGGMAEGRLVLVLDVDPDAGLASVMLTHTDFEIRTSLDVVVTATELGLPFDLAFETDLVGPVGIDTLCGKALGRVDEPLLDDLRDAVDMGEIPDSLIDRVGMPLRGQADARWEWKVQEGAVLDRILATYAPAAAGTLNPVQVLAAAFSAIGCGDVRQDPLIAVTHCLVAYRVRRETPPAPILALLAEPPIRAALGNDVLRAIGPMLLVA